MNLHLNPVPALHALVQGVDGRSIFFLSTQVFDGTAPLNPKIHGYGLDVMELAGIPAGKYFAAEGRTGPEGEGVELDISSNGQKFDFQSPKPTASDKIAVLLQNGERLAAPLFVVLRNSKGRPVAGSEVDPRGEVSFRNVAPGKYEVVAVSPARAFSVELMPSAQGGSGHTLEVEPGSSVNVTISLTGGEVTIQGYVKHAGRPVSSAMVVLVPKNSEGHPELFRRDQSDQDGSFSLPSVLPAIYTVIAIEDGWDLDWAKPDVTARYVERGQLIQVDDRTERQVQLREPVQVQTK